MLKNRNLVFSMLLLSALLAGCMSEAETFIQGKWARGDVHYWAEWNFERGAYWFEYDDTHINRFEKGSYAVLEYGDDFIVIELFNREGSEPSYEEYEQVHITLDTAAETLHIYRGDYLRVDDSSLHSLSTAQAP